MKLNKSTYKSYHPPVCLFLGYIVGCIAFIWILEKFRNVIRSFDFELWIFNGILRFLIFLIAFGIAILLFFIPTYLFGYRSNKIYRGIAFYKFINSVAVICPIIVIVSIILLNNAVGHLNFDYTLFDLFAVGAEIMYPVAIRFVWYHKFLGIRKCPMCGLINTMEAQSITERKIGTKVNVYDEGVIRYKPTMYAYEEKEKTTKMVCSVCEGIDYDTEKTEERI